MEITYNLPHVFSPEASQVDNACALRALLDCQIALNLAWLQYHAVPSLYESGVVYGRTKIWEPTPALILPNKHPRQAGRMTIWEPLGTTGGKKRADCKSLGPALVAQYRHQGKGARCVFRFMPRQDGTGFLDFHILVEFPNGDHEDPSRILGMGSEQLTGFSNIFR
jgi:hypothetical protein